MKHAFKTFQMSSPFISLVVFLLLFFFPLQLHDADQWKK